MSTLQVIFDGRNFTFSPGTTVRIGRSSENDIVVNAPTVSRRHAQLSFEAAGWVWQNSGQAPTFLAGQPVAQFAVGQQVDVTLASPQGPTLRLASAAGPAAAGGPGGTELAGGAGGVGGQTNLAGQAPGFGAGPGVAPAGAAAFAAPRQRAPAGYPAGAPQDYAAAAPPQDFAQQGYAQQPGYPGAGQVGYLGAGQPGAPDQQGWPAQPGYPGQQPYGGVPPQGYPGQPGATPPGQAMP